MYVDYLQEARLDLLRHHGTSPTPNPGEGLVVVRTVVEYLRPIRLADAPLSGRDLGVRGAGGVVHARVRADDRRRRFTPGRPPSLAPFVFAAGRPRRLTAEERDRLRDDARRPTVRGQPPGAAWATRPRSRAPADPGPLLRRRRARPRQQRAVLRLRPRGAGGGADRGVPGGPRVRHRRHRWSRAARWTTSAQLNLRPEPYDVWSRVAAVGRTSVTLESEIRDGDRVMARAEWSRSTSTRRATRHRWHPRHRELFEQRRDAQGGS